MKKVMYCPLCKNELRFYDKTLRCLNNHSYDISKKGYVNLLLPNQHHSEKSGDEKGMILSRVRFLNTGKYNCLRDLILTTLRELISSFDKEYVIGDLGCGEGYYTVYYHQELSKLIPLTTYGVDLSKQAINECANRQRSKHIDNMMFIIGNINYVPLLDESLDFIVNSFSRIDEKEFVRLLKKDGYFLRILPGKDHLLELKQVLYENVRLNEDKEERIDGLEFVRSFEVSDVIYLNNQEIRDLFSMTPYYYKSPKDTSEKLMNLENLTTKISFKILVYKK